MTTWAIIPVKSLPHSKSRLAPFLSQEARAELTRCLLHRLLAILHEVPQIDEVVIVSRDPSVARLAERHGAHVVAEGEEDALNASVRVGQAFAVAHGARAILILPSDLPLVMPEDIAALWGETAVFDPSQAVICSDRHQEGTNALLLPAVGPFQFQYGPQSYQKHHREAERVKLLLHTAVIPGLQFDLDTVQDWELYRRRQTNTLTWSLQ